MILPVSLTTAAALADSVTLSSSERLGLEFLASREQQWSFEELVTYYQGLRVHGADFTKIATKTCTKIINLCRINTTQVSCSGATCTLDISVHSFSKF